MKEMKRFLSLLLCLVMLVGVLPVNALAAAPAATESSAPTEAPLADSAEESDTLEKSSVHTTEPTEPEVIAVTGITLDQTALEVGVGAESVTLTATVTPEDATDKTVIWTSSEPGVASVEDGVLTFGCMGEAVITATAGDFSANCTVTVGEGEATAYENSDTIYVLAGSDFQPSDDKPATGAAQVKSILTQIQKGYSRMDGFLFMGDYEYSSTNSTSESTTGKNALQGAIQEAYGDSLYEVYIQGNHDPDSLTTNGTLTTSGPHDADDYGVFVINEKDYMWYNDDETTIKNTASNLESYLNAKVDAKYSKPIFVLSHLPLHYSMRTLKGGNDGMHANYIFDVLNEAGKDGLNIIYLFGHDHSHGWDDYLGGAAIFLTKGDTINIAQNSTTTYNVEDLYFTYMNAGYVGYYGNTGSGADTTLTMTTFAITDTEVTISRYDSNGEHVLKAKGFYGGEYPDNNYANPVYAADTDVVKSSYTLELNQFEPDPTVEDETTGITVTAPGIIGVTVTQKQNPTYDTEKYSAYASYDITLTGYTQGNTATVTIPVPAGFNTSKPAVVLDQGAQIAKDTDLSDGITFTTNHFSEYDVAQVDESAGVTASGNLVSDTIVDNNSSAPQAGNYYLIRPVRDGNGTLTNVSTKVNNSTGLDVVDTGLNAQDNNVWYYDGTHIILRSTGEYLSVGSAQDAAALTNNANATNLVNSVYENTNYRGTYTLAATQNATYKYLNRAGSGSFAGAWSSDGNGDEGSRWYFYKVTFGSGDPVTLTVTPASKTVTKGTTATLTASVLVNGKAATSKNITWTSSDPTVATVDDNGVVTGVIDGDVTITVTLTKANGQNVNGTVSVTIPVTVTTKEIKSISLDPMTGTVQRGSSSGATTGSKLTVTYADDTTDEVNVTLSMLTGTYNTAVNGTYTDLTVTYLGYTFDYTLNVVNVAGNDHPDYPNEGAVKVTKHATGVDFQASGVAQVELAVSGVPIKKGADVIVMLDTSSSMTDDFGGSTRLAVLQTSLENLLKQLKANGADGEPMDIRIAVADFNRYYRNEPSPYYLNENDHLNGANVRGNQDEAPLVYTGTENLTDGAFVDVHTLDDNHFSANGKKPLNTTSGTNYDYAFDAVYQLGEAITAANAEKELDRDLFVIFMSDGAPYQYNYFSSGSEGDGAEYWNNWLQGTLTDNMYAANANRNYYNEDGKHWMAEAIKGDPSQTYRVIRKQNDGTITNLEPTDTTNIYMVPGLGAKMYSIGFCLADDKDVTVASMDMVIRNIASSNEYYFRADTPNALADAFNAIGADIAYAASNARFVDQMGENYNIQLATVNYAPMGSTEKTKTITPTIEVLTYDIYTRADYEDELCTLAQIGDRKTNTDGSYIYTVQEKVTFNEDGTEAYSNVNSIGPDGNTITAGSNILLNGVIYANTFWYNTTANAVAIVGVDIPEKSNGGLTSGPSTTELPKETFYWKVGTVKTQELAIRYYVYLDQAMEGHREAGSYNTNEYATLYYDNYLGNSCYKDGPVPVLAWKAARVSYGFYLVNTDGVPVNISGEPVSFSDRVIIVDRSPGDEVLLNSGEEVDPMVIISKNVLPDGYNLYDEEATYTVHVNSNGTGSWEINKGTVDEDGNTVDLAATTYVTDFSGTVQYSNKLTEDEISYDYTHTVVWFAIKWEPKPMPDTVVIDYGLPVDIHVMTNDMFGKYGTLVGVAAGDLTNSSKTENAITTTEANGSFGSAAVTSVESGVIRYTPANMEMNDADVFTYSVIYSNDNYTQNNGNYYQTVTVIPATTIYYEDSFIDLSSYTWTDGGWELKDQSGWSKVTDGTYDGNADITQAEDRPGSINYAFGTVIDANNIYGYDGAYTKCSEYSLGSAVMATVDYDNYAQAGFSFYGTGFDVISLTSNQTGTILVTVTDKNDKVVRNVTVDTYYGYTQKGEEWIPSPNNPNALYQVPVIEIAGLEYGMYNVTIKAMYDEIFDHSQYSGEEKYDFYLDAIRIYDPANDGAVDETIKDAYTADNEGWPIYEELRNNVISEAELAGASEVAGIVFIDSNDKVESVADYTNVGPNNELYLASGQAIVFELNLSAEKVASVHLGIKSATENTPVSYKIFDGTTVENENDVDAIAAQTISTSTGMYYDITSLKDKTIVVYNSGSGMLSLTDIKVTFTEDPGIVENLFYASAEVINKLVENMNTSVTTEPTTFEVAVTPAPATVGGRITVTVTTSADVEAVSVDGTIVTRYSTSGENRVWTASVSASEAGTKSIVVNAYNANGNQSATTTVTAEVQTVQGSAIRIIVNLLKSWFNW